MSDPLDKYFSERQSTVPSATPPPGQWERIRNGQLVLDSTKKRPIAFWALALALCFGLGLGILTGAYFFGAQCPATSAAEDDYASTALDMAAAGPMTTDGVLASSTSPAPASAPRSSVPTAPAANTKQGKQASVSADSTQSVVLNQATYPLLSASSMVEGVPEEVKETGSFQLQIEDLADTPVLNPQREEALSINRTAIPKLSTFEQGPVRPARLGYHQSRLTNKAISASLTPAKISDRKPNSRARWEVGLHVTPRFSDATTDIGTLSETDNGLNPKQFEFDGREVTLYPTTTLNADLNRRFQLRVISFEAARQFRNGFRLGIGVAWTPRHVEGLLDQQQYLNGQLLEGEWATSHTIESQEAYLSVHTDYTFRRRRRFRPYLGFELRTYAYDDYNYQEQLFESSSGLGETASSVNSTSQGTVNYLQITPRAGFQYDLTNRLSVGLELGPGAGIGGRWKW